MCSQPRRPITISIHFEPGELYLPVTIRYHFRTRFAVSAAKAFGWCTDYHSGSEDHALMAEETGSRKVDHVAEDTLILIDTFQAKEDKVEKQKLVKLYPNQLSWNATHISGPAKYSQFLYQITPDGENTSHLDFTGAFLDWAHEKLSEAEKSRLSRQLCREDAEAWKHLAKAMKKDLKP